MRVVHKGLYILVNLSSRGDVIDISHVDPDEVLTCGCDCNYM